MRVFLFKEKDTDYSKERNIPLGDFDQEYSQGSVLRYLQKCQPRVLQARPCCQLLEGAEQVSVSDLPRTESNGGLLRANDNMSFEFKNEITKREGEALLVLSIPHVGVDFLPGLRPQLCFQHSPTFVALLPPQKA